MKDFTKENLVQETETGRRISLKLKIILRIIIPSLETKICILVRKIVSCYNNKMNDCNSKQNLYLDKDFTKHLGITEVSRNTVSHARSEKRFFETSVQRGRII